MATPISHHFPPGTLIANYRIEALIGSGGMGTVYRAVHEWTGREVALKFLHLGHSSENPKALSRFRQEAQAAVALRHPNVIDVLHMGAHGGVAYMVLELLHGCSLRERLEQQGRLSPPEACGCLLPIMDALATAHRAGLVHRDIKPDNIFLAKTPQQTMVPKLLDFGIAKIVGAPGLEGLTTTGGIIGTPAYMSPEQLHGQNVDARTDVWALGVVLYELLSGELPFADSASIPALLVRLVSENIPLLHEAYPALELPAPVGAVVEGALQRDPQQRYSSVEVMSMALEEACKPLLAMEKWDQAASIRVSTGRPATLSGREQIVGTETTTQMCAETGELSVHDTQPPTGTRRPRMYWVYGLLGAGGLLLALALGNAFNFPGKEAKSSSRSTEEHEPPHRTPQVPSTPRQEEVAPQAQREHLTAAEEERAVNKGLGSPDGSATQADALQKTESPASLPETAPKAFQEQPEPKPAVVSAPTPDRPPAPRSEHVQPTFPAKAAQRAKATQTVESSISVEPQSTVPEPATPARLKGRRNGPSVIDEF